MSSLENLKLKIKNHPLDVSFQEVILFIDSNYIFTPTRFTNGEVINEAGQNSGSCKLFSFGKSENLSVAETLVCFGDYYRNDVLLNPEGTDHQNIRNFIKYGWEGIRFENNALKLMEI
jgi:HopJ type III effector protein